MAEDQRTIGIKTRREVLGDDHVNAAMQATDSFDQPLEDVLHEFAWGSVWARPGLDRRTRSLLTLVLLTALDRPEELRVHVRGAIRNGVTVEEISEALLHSSVYCGIPAAIGGFKVARMVIAETGS